MPVRKKFNDQKVLGLVREGLRPLLRLNATEASTHMQFLRSIKRKDRQIFDEAFHKCCEAQTKDIDEKWQLNTPKVSHLKLNMFLLTLLLLLCVTASCFVQKIIGWFVGSAQFGLWIVRV